jgi:ubiquinone/menaquinone biosynthesis C-methylase UbiE
MSEDALQYAPDKLAALHEAARIARPGARFVCTVFELDPENVASLPVLGVDPVDDYRPLLEQSGFTVDRYDEVPGWPEPMTRAYSAVLAAKEALTAEMGELAVASLSAEMAVTLARSPYKRRALIVASRN